MAARTNRILTAIVDGFDAFSLRSNIALTMTFHRRSVRYSGTFIPGLLAAAAITGSLLAQAPMTANDDSMMMEGDPMAMGGGEAARTFDRKDLDFFEAKIRPLLLGRCLNCHSDQGSRVRAGLRLDTHTQLLVGGDTGPAIVPGDPDASLLIQAVRYDDPGLEMPPRGRLTNDEIALLEEWVLRGAPMPSAPVLDVDPGNEHRWTEDDIEAGRDHWAYRPVERPALPEVSDPHWPLNEVDRFVLADLDRRGLAPVGPATATTWLRRVTFDLIGLPPSPEEIEAFEADESPLARQRVVDRLLTSPAFGERWGRHWLDVARYAESSGKENNIAYPHAWRYRDWVIEAFNDDVPYDRFITRQLAGDLLDAETEDDAARNLIATGYLAIGTKGHNQQGEAQFRLDVIDEQIDAITQGLLATTVACARCHDHKFDPIPQRDYYAMAGILASTQTRFGTFEGPGNRHGAALIELPAGASLSDGASVPAGFRSSITAARDRAAGRVDAAEAIRVELRAAGIRNPRSARDRLTPAQQRTLQQARNAEGQVRISESSLARFDQAGRPTIENFVCMGVVEGEVRDAPFLERGELDGRGPTVPRGFVQVIESDWTPSIDSSESGRLQLAEWIADERNPLTSRVWANRIWSHLFGRGVVATPDNFGLSGEQPTNAPLLDHLATRLVDFEWSTKAMVREIVLSRTYGMSSAWSRAQAETDPDEIALWRMPKRRLEAEAIRDAMLAAGGILESDIPDGSAAGGLEGQLQARILDRIITQSGASFANHRSVYLPVVRGHLPESLAVFDFPEPNFVTGTRDRTNVATQALFLMNSDEVTRLADATARRVLAEAGRTSDRIGLAFRICFGRTPTTNEFIACRDFLREYRNAREDDDRQRVASSTPAERRAEARRSRNQNRARGDRATPNRTDGEFAAYSAMCQTLFQSAEFRTID
ncbi:MAG: PSD1 and planctomycete cytochrome C domain-containing protein [Phycisphaerales bacterium]|nr:PSD1 and planctomycete cytochrome C domain-containing protein [Phycisphaerales bacterium]